VTRKKFFFIPAVRPNTKFWLPTSAPAAVWIETTIARSTAAGVQVCCAWHTAQGGHRCARTEPSSRPQKKCAHERCCECRRWISSTRRGRLTSRGMVTSLTSVVWRVPSARRIMPRHVAHQRRRIVAKPTYAPASLTRATDDLHTRRRTHCLALTLSCTACRRPERRHSGVAVGQPAEQRQLELLQLLPAGAVGGSAVIHCVTHHPDTRRVEPMWCIVCCCSHAHPLPSADRFREPTKLAAADCLHCHAWTVRPYVAVAPSFVFPLLQVNNISDVPCSQPYTRSTIGTTGSQLAVSPGAVFQGS